MTDLTPDTLAQLRAIHETHGLNREQVGSLLDALATEKQAREEADDRRNWYHAEADLQHARADKAERERQIAENREMRFMLERDASNGKRAEAGAALKAALDDMEQLANKWGQYAATAHHHDHVVYVMHSDRLRDLVAKHRGGA